MVCLSAAKVSTFHHLLSAVDKGLSGAPLALPCSYVCSQPVQWQFLFPCEHLVFSKRSNPPAAVSKCGNFIHPTLPMSFGR